MAMPLTPGTVIIVDDDAAVRRALKFSLELEGLEVRAFGGGAELLAELQLPNQACLVVDYYMPSINGLELLQHLRQKAISLPAILITSKATSEIRRRAARAGVRQVLEKPLSDGALLDCIQTAFAEVGTA
jgi:two-component system response regulator FixJ